MGHHWSLAQEDWSVTSRSSLVPHEGIPRSCPGVIPSLHTQGGSPGPTSLPLSRIALRFMLCGQYPVLYYLRHQGYQLPSPSSSLHPQGEERTLRGGSQLGTCRNPWAATGKRVPSAGHLTLLQMLLSPGAGQSLPQDEPLESKGPSGTLITLKSMWRPMLCWHGWSHKERGSLRSSVFKELQLNLIPQMDEYGKSALAVLEISHVTRRMAGDSPSVLSHHRD